MLWTRPWCPHGTGWLPLTFPAAGVRGMFRIAEVLKIPVIWIEGARPRQPEQRAWPASRQKGEAMPPAPHIQHRRRLAWFACAMPESFAVKFTPGEHAVLH
jgi:hypothetical protein